MMGGSCFERLRGWFTLQLSCASVSMRLFSCPICEVARMTLFSCLMLHSCLMATGQFAHRSQLYFHGLRVAGLHA